MPSIICQDLGFAWPDGVSLLRNVNLSLGSGRHGLIGRNGSGKTSVMRIFAGELAPTTGKVVLSGDPLYVPQNIALSSTATTAELLGIAGKIAALRAVDAGSADPEHYASIGDDWDIEERARGWLGKFSPSSGLLNHPDVLDRPTVALSGGEAMAVALTGLVLAKPDITLLDEPTNNLDREARDWFYQTVENWSSLLVVISHDRELMERMDSILAIETGKLERYDRQHAGAGFRPRRILRRADRSQSRYALPGRFVHDQGMENAGYENHCGQGNCRDVKRSKSPYRSNILFAVRNCENGGKGFPCSTLISQAHFLPQTMQGIATP